MNSKKVALITGASRGIGQAILQKLAQHFVVLGTATSETGAQKIEQFIQEHHLEGRGLVLDFNQPQTLETLLQHCSDVAVLVNNAGLTRDTLSMRMTDSDWDCVLNTNLKGAFQLSRAFMRTMMKNRWGRIVNIASVVGFTGNAGQANYCASKAGLIGLTKALARELGPRNITVNAVAPGFIETDMTQTLSDEQKKQMLQNIPLNRPGSAQDVAEAVAFLVSDSAAYITGTTLHVNGGMLMP